MVNGRGDGSPLESVGAVPGAKVTAAFKLLSNETRLAILLSLWEAHDPHGGDNALSFTELRESVGVRQGEQFNYHLEKVVGEFVQKTDDGYELRRNGLMLVQSIIAGIGYEDPTLDPTAIDATCRRCGGDTTVTYERNYVYQVCSECMGMVSAEDPHPDGTLFAWTFEPTGLSGRTAEDVFTASTIKNFARIALRFEDLCPVCSGQVEWSLDVCPDHDAPPDGDCPGCGREEPAFVREACTICKSAGHGSPGIKVLFHPAVISFFYDHGIEIGFTGQTSFEDVIQTLELVEEFEETVQSVDPPRVRVTVTHDGDALHLELDESMNVVDVREDP